MRALLLFFALITVVAGFIHNYRREAQHEWHAFEKRYQETTLRPDKQAQVEETVATPSPKKELENVAVVEQPIEQPKQQEKLVEETPYQPTKKDPLHKMSQSIKESETFKELINFSVDELELVKKHEENRAEFREMGQSVAQTLIQCLTDQSCVEDDQQTYQDLSEMRSHQLLERTLFVGLSLQDIDPSAPMINQQMIAQVLAIPSPALHYAALEILGGQQLEDQQFKQFLDQARALPVESRGHLFSRLENEANRVPSRRADYVAGLESAVSQDPATALEVMKHLPFINLSAQELTRVSQGLCRHHERQSGGEWEMIQYHHGQYNELKGHNIQLQSLCR